VFIIRSFSLFYKGRSQKTFAQRPNAKIPVVAAFAHAAGRHTGNKK
jgi:hypothetical protein